MKKAQNVGRQKRPLELLVGLDDWRAGLVLHVTEEIWRVMKREKLTKAELAKRIGCGASHVTQLLNGGRNMTLRTLADICAALQYRPTFRLRPNATLTALAPLEPPPMFVALLESPRPQAGFPSPAADYVEDVLDLNKLMVGNPPATFYVRVKGHSLMDAGILDGDILVVDRSLDAVPPRIVVAVVDGSLYVKRLRDLRGRMALVSENVADAKAFPPIYFDQCQESTVWGVVTGVVRKL
ncbi:MAG: LexA family protein [Panacagrimonas sp.]